MVAEVFLFPMSFAQQRLWFLDQLEPESAAYNIPGAVRLRGRLDRSALSESLNEIIRRHEALRTSFNMLEGQPVQVITPSLQIELKVTSLEEVDEAEREEWAEKLVMEESQRAFDLKRAPLLRASLLRLGEEDHIFLLTMHHIISDGWSIGVMLAELTALYAAYLEGKPSPLPELPIQYADFAVWQRDWLKGEVLEEQLSYWKEQLGGELPALELPADYARPQVPTYEGAYYPFTLSQELTDSLKALSQQTGVTLFVTLLAAFKTLLYRYCGQEEIIVGTPIANRNRSETESLIGFFANTLALRSDLSGDPGFLELLNRIQKVMVGAHAHQDVPFEKIVEELQPERSLGSNPLFQVVFLLLDSLPKSVNLPGITFEPWKLDWKAVKFDLEFHVSDGPAGLTCSVAYSTDLFEEATIARLAVHYTTLLEAIVAAPETRISRLSMLNTSEREELLERSKAALSRPVPQATLAQLFAEQAARTPDATAVIFQEQSLSFRQLDEQSNRLARHLRSLSFSSGTVAGMLLERSSDLVVALLASLKAGCAVMPLEASAPPERWSGLIKQSSIKCLITNAALADRLLEVTDESSLPVLINLDAAASRIAEESPEPLDEAATFESDAYVIALAEQGGIRSVAFTHSDVQRRLSALQELFELREGERVLHKASFDESACVWELLWPLLYGGRVVVAPPDADDRAVRRLLITEQVSIAHADATALSAWLAAEETDAREDDEAAPSFALRLIIYSGEAAARPVAQIWQERGAQLAQVYEVRDACADVLVSLASARRAQPEAVLIEGRPVPNISVAVLDESGELAPVGVSGEICIGTERKQTGERGRWLADGRLRVEARAGVAAWIKGHRVVYSDVEAALLEHASIEECVVRARRAACGPRLAAYVVSASPVADGELTEWLGQRLPAFMLPQLFVELKRLPLRPGGAVDEAALANLSVTDERQIQELEQRLLEVEGVSEVAVVEQEVEDEQTLLHLLDIVAEPEAEAKTEESVPAQAQDVGEETSETIEAKSNGEATEASPAISDGGPLTLDDALPKTLAEMLYRAAESSTEGVTYLSGQSVENQSYSRLLDEATALRRLLSSNGVRAGEPVILQLEDNRQFVSAFWACVLEGAVPAPLATAPSYEQESNATRMLQNVWQMLGCPLVLTDTARAAQIREVLEQAGDEVKVVALEEAAAVEDAVERARVEVSPDDLALLLFTSGSTGKPKGVQLSHRNLISHAVANIELSSYTVEDVSLNWMPLTHVGGIVMFHLRDVFIGCRQVHVPTSEILAEPLRWLDLMDEYGATTTWAANFAYGLINEEIERLNSESSARSWDLSRMRFIVNGGEAVNAATGRKFLQLLSRFGLPATSMRPAYGMSETSSAITFSSGFTLDSISDSDKFVSVGVPYAGVTLRIVDEKGEVTSEGNTGYLQVRGSTITSGYYKNPSLNAEVFTDGWFITGDLAFIKDGSMTITGREKDVIIINGANYYSHEIESVVEEIPGVVGSYTAACAIRKPQSDTDGVAIFFNSELAEQDEQIKQINEIRQKVGQKFGVRPDYVLPVEKEEIPKTSIGKIQRTQLRQRFEAGGFSTLLKKLDLAFESANTLPDWFYRQVWRPKHARQSARRTGTKRFLLFLDEAGLGARLGERLSETGSQCITVAAGTEFRRDSRFGFQLSPQRPEHYEQLLALLAEDGLLPEEVLHLWAYDAPQASDLKSLSGSQERGFYSIFQLAQALSQVIKGDAQEASSSSIGTVRLTVVTADAQPSAEGTMRVFHHAALPGLLKSMRSELPWLECRQVDLESGGIEKGAEQVLKELSLYKPDAEVSYRSGVRLVPLLRKAQMLREDRQPVPFKRGGLYLLTGGTGGVGSHLARCLIERYGVRLLLVGRTPLDSNEADTTSSVGSSDSAAVSRRLERLRAIESAGADNCLYRAVDVCDLEGLRRAVRDAEERWQEPLAGALHLAGEENLARHWREINEQWIAAQTREALEAAMRSKVEGTWALYEILRERVGAFFVGFSSVNSLFGAASFASYSAANSFLDGYVQYQQERAGGVRGWSFNWTMWDGMGMSEGAPAFTREASRSLGYHIVTAEQGVQSLLAGLSRKPSRIVVGVDAAQGQARRVVESLTPPARKLVAYYTANAPADSLGSRLREALASDASERKPVDCELVLVQEMPRAAGGEIDRRKLSLPVRRKSRQKSGQDAPRTDVEIQLAEIWKRLLGIRELGIHDSFFELGGHSLLAIQLISQVNKAFKVELTLAQLFEAPTIASLAELLLRIESAPGQVEAVARLRKQLDAMTAEEIKAALLARQGAQV
ncbi:MAG TPA: condensation domain-containing protein [Pyrinomonadaceae bacterium]|nr:condensation domain-containing protein [Pyrinomonadaceae bacterium]